MRPIKNDVDNAFQYYFRCNSTLANEDTLYNVDCMPALDLSYTSLEFIRITRREDATMQCPKAMQNDSNYVGGVSQNSFIHGSCPRAKSFFFNLILTERNMQLTLI